MRNENIENQNPDFKTMPVILVDVNEASFVHHAIYELRRQFHGAKTGVPSLFYAPEDIPDSAETLVIVGRAMAARLASSVAITDDDPGPEGFVLTSVTLPDGRKAIVAAGSDEMGTNYAVLQLHQLLIEAGSLQSLSANLDLHERPRYAKRAIYLHQHWRYNYPYSTWAWSVEDWKRAIDMVASMRFNLVMIWPHMDMLAPPLDITEREHLADLREVIDYAHRKRGIKIWLMDPANVLLDQAHVKRLPMEERDYYAYAHMEGGGLKNPASPDERAALLANREELYRHVPNADGYGYIDSDPGGWLGSPASEYVGLLAANRELIDKYHERPQEVTIFNWLLAGWGNGTCQEIWAEAMSGVVEKVSEPRGFLAHFANHVEIAAKLNHLPQTLLFPYGIVDGEPSFPLTSLEFDQLGRAFQFAARYPELGGVIGNVQTFLIQLPNIYYVASATWNGTVPADSYLELLQSLARQIFPDAAGLLVAGWTQLFKPGSAAADSVAKQLSALQREDNLRTGIVGKAIFPSPQQILSDLTILLGIHARAQAVVETVAAGGTSAELYAAMRDYFQRMLDWQQHNGFFGTYAANKEVIYDQFMYDANCRSVKAAHDRYFENREPQDFQTRLINDLTQGGYTPWIVEAMVGQLFGTIASKMGSIEAALFKRFPPTHETMPWTQPGMATE